MYIYIYIHIYIYIYICVYRHNDDYRCMHEEFNVDRQLAIESYRKLMVYLWLHFF